MPAGLSKTKEGSEWLANFHEQDREAAKLLLDGLRYASASSMRIRLTELIERGFAEGGFQQPTLVIPIRTGKELGVDPPRRAVMFESATPDQMISNEPGSEGFCANLIRDFKKANKGKYDLLHPSSSLEELREKRIHSVVLVGDYAGTGSQAIDSANTWTRNSTIRSWRSFGWLHIHVVLYAASLEGKNAMEKSGSIDNNLSIYKIAESFNSAGWSSNQRKDVERICSDYVHSRFRRDALGWHRNAGLFFMEHTVPNNLPAILWQGKGPTQRADHRWYPLFPERTLPVSLQRFLSAQGSRTDLPTRENDEPTSEMLLFLKRIENGDRHPDRLAARLNRSLIDVARILSILEELDLIDKSLRLTNEGRSTLHNRQVPVSSRYQLKGSDKPYYPQQLRRVDDI